MQELMVLSGNPSRRRRKGRKSRTAKQRAATRKLVAFMRRRRGGRRSSVAVNPAPRRRKYRRSVRARMRFAGRRAQRGFLALGGRAGTLAKPFSMVAPALTGAVGAVAVNAILSRIPLPAILMQGKTRYLTQGAVAIGLGMLASQFRIVGGATAAKMAEGSLTVTLADAIREFAFDAGINLSGMGYYLPGLRVRAAPPSGGRPGMQMGKYVTGPGAQVMPLVTRRGNQFSNINRAF